VTPTEQRLVRLDDRSLKITAVYRSVRAAATHLDVSRSAIYDALTRGSIVAGSFWATESAFDQRSSAFDTGTVAEFIRIHPDKYYA